MKNQGQLVQPPGGIPFTPERFGAIGDGVTDDTAAWLACVNSAAGRLIMARGTYRIAMTLADQDVVIDLCGTGKFIQNLGQPVLRITRTAEAAQAVTPAVATMTGSIAGNVLTVTAWAGSPVYPGMYLTGANVTAGTMVTRTINASTHGVGTYNVSISQTAASAAVTGTCAFTPFVLLTSNIDISAGVGSALAIASVLGWNEGDVATLYSQDSYPFAVGVWGAGANIYMSNLFQVKGVGLAFTGGGAGFAVDNVVVGQTSGATATVSSTTGTATGFIMFPKISGGVQFVNGENLQVGGVTLGVASGAPFLFTSEFFEYGFPTAPMIQKMKRNVVNIRNATFDTATDMDTIVGMSGPDPARGYLGALILEGCVSPVLDNIIFDGAYAKGIQLFSCWKARVKAHCNKLGDYAQTTEQAYGYLIESVGADNSADVYITGGNCRHGFTTNTLPNSAFAFSTLWGRGTSKNWVVRGNMGDCWSGAFDTHPGSINGSFVGCVVHNSNCFERPITGSGGFQNRGFGTTFLNCVSIGGMLDFSDASAGYIAGFYHINTYKGCIAKHCSGVGFGISGTPDSGFTSVDFEDCSYAADMTTFLPNEWLQAGWKELDTGAHTIRINRCIARNPGNTAIYLTSAGRFHINDFIADYVEVPSNQSEGCIRIDSATARVFIGNIRVAQGSNNANNPAHFIRYTAATNSGLIEISGDLVCTNSSVPPIFISNTGAGTATPLWRRPSTIFGGTAVLAAGTATVTFPRALPDALYRVKMAGNSVDPIRWGTKLAASFVITSSNAASTMSVDWEVSY